MEFPQAYHLTWGTYGARLIGSRKPHVTLQQNVYGTPLPRPDPKVERGAKASMVQSIVALTVEQRLLVESSIIDLASRYDWTIHAIAIQRDHCHVVITAMREGQALRDALKAIASKALNAKFGKRTWWAEKGSAKYVWERSYFENVKRYVQRQRDF